MAENDILRDAADLGIYGEKGKLQVANFLDGSGQLGVGFNQAYMDAATPLTFIPTAIVVLTTPAMYGTNNKFGEALKNLIETHAKTITGIDFGYTIETEEGGQMHDGQTIAVPTQNKRTAVNPSFTFDELPGNLVWQLFYTWARDIQDADTNTSRQYKADNGDSYQFLQSDYTMTMMAIQFDRTCKPENIIAAALYTNMFPTDPGGMLGLERNQATTKAVERTVEMTGIVHHNETIREQAIELATTLQLANATYNADSKNIVSRSLPKDAVKDGAISIPQNLDDTGLQRDASRAIATA
jgi:hypothetical protein